MGQFVIAFIHAGIPLFVDCGFNPGFSMAVMSHAFLFFIMFRGFYRDAYNCCSTVSARSKKSVAIQSTDDNLNELKSNGHGVARSNGSATVANGTASEGHQQPMYLYSYLKKSQREINGKNGTGKKGKKRR